MYTNKLHLLQALQARWGGDGVPEIRHVVGAGNAGERRQRGDEVSHPASVAVTGIQAQAPASACRTEEPTVIE